MTARVDVTFKYKIGIFSDINNQLINQKLGIQSIYRAI